jgi:hypothetical protein
MSDSEPPPKSSQSPYTGEQRAAPYALSRLSGPVSLTDVAREIEQADLWIASNASAQLGVIAEQIAALRDKAQRVLEQARANAELHRAEARFPRHPGHIYHLYEREPNARYWSLLSPADWGGAPPHRFLGSYRLELDQSWTPVEQLAERDQKQEDLERFLNAKLLPGRSE